MVEEPVIGPLSHSLREDGLSAGEQSPDRGVNVDADTEIINSAATTWMSNLIARGDLRILTVYGS
ncbi:MAG: hypothetical protein AB2705_08465 [Candidatus Thiodiazotropha sp.]